MNSQYRDNVKSKTVALKKKKWLVIGNLTLGIWNNAIIYLSDFQTIAFQCPKQPLLNQLYTILCIEKPIERFHWRGQHLCKFMWTKEIVCVSKEFNSHKIFVWNTKMATASLFWNIKMAPVTSYMWKRSILYWRGIFRNSITYTFLSGNHTRFWDKRAQVFFSTLGWNSWIFFINQVFRA